MPQSLLAFLCLLINTLAISARESCRSTHGGADLRGSEFISGGVYIQTAQSYGSATFNFCRSSPGLGTCSRCEPHTGSAFSPHSPNTPVYCLLSDSCFSVGNFLKILLRITSIALLVQLHGTLFVCNPLFCSSIQLYGLLTVCLQ